MQYGQYTTIEGLASILSEDQMRQIPEKDRREQRPKCSISNNQDESSPKNNKNINSNGHVLHILVVGQKI